MTVNGPYTSGHSDACTSVKVALASRSALINIGLERLLVEVPGAQAHRFEIRTGCDIETLLAMEPKVIVADVMDMPSITRGLQKRCQSARVLLVSPQSHMGGLSDKAKIGACGFAPYRSPIERCVGMLREIVTCPVPTIGASPCEVCPLPMTLLAPSLPLSPRELAVFELIGLGSSTRDIARELQLSVKTVETHQQAIKRKLGLEDARSLAESAARWHSGEFVSP